MAKAGKPENTAESAARKGDQAAQDKTPVMDIPRSISVRQLAEMLDVDSINIIKQLMRTGIMANINQIIDYDTAATIVTTLGFKPHLTPLKDQMMASAAEEGKKQKITYRKTKSNRWKLLRKQEENKYAEGQRSLF